MTAIPPYYGDRPPRRPVEAPEPIPVAMWDEDRLRAMETALERIQGALLRIETLVQHLYSPRKDYDPGF